MNKYFVRWRFWFSSWHFFKLPSPPTVSLISIMIVWALVPVFHLDYQFYLWTAVLWKSFSSWKKRLLNASFESLEPGPEKNMSCESFETMPVSLKISGFFSYAAYRASTTQSPMAPNALADLRPYNVTRLLIARWSLGRTRPSSIALYEKTYFFCSLIK